MHAELESELKYAKQEASHQNKIWHETIDQLERKLGEKQAETWKLNMLISTLERK